MISPPFRSCVACRISRPKRELIRIHLVPGGRLGVDLDGGSGRGVYVCPRHACLELAVRRGEFARCLKVTLAPMTVEALEALIRERILRKVAALLGLARRARKIASGAEAVESAVKRHSARLILSAADASTNSVTKLQSLAAEVGIAWMQAMGKEELGAALGVAPRACIAVMDSHFAGAVMTVLKKMPVEMDAREAAWLGRRVCGQSGASEGLGVIRRGND
ncbi:MAG: DUF448 domain-containing protein [bacterium]|uniref:DUF448 domain-containing protein n=1 Tax=Candidatus Methylomirabilis tolerans TaxID=3123416 RepID=A0AAJ1ETP9_9BACT|nr:DUF448 domain-containing protein [Candidatus Methylomirabilis sp.]